jgi:DnaJ-class molecular chaperone
MTLSAARTLQPHRPKEYEAEGTAVREEDRQAECPGCAGTGFAPLPPTGPIPGYAQCPDCDGFGRVWPDDEFAVDVVLGANSRRFYRMGEAEARRACEQTAESGMPAVLLRRDGDGWVEVERFAAAPPSPRLVPVKARPYSSWRR